ncbi:hypothetical protein NMY22_g6958 [Coprinellus aureogranulatus]|nr:hypothetical protein NMY22_g6958 [Coprinellus aureogranulatus]
MAKIIKYYPTMPLRSNVTEESKSTSPVLNRHVCHVCGPETQSTGCAEGHNTVKSEAGTQESSVNSTVNNAASQASMLYSAFWVKRNNNGIIARFQSIRNSQKLTIIVEPRRTPVVLLVDNDFIILVLTSAFFLFICWLLLKGIMAVL